MASSEVVMLRVRIVIALVCALPALPAGQTSPMAQCSPAEPLATVLREAYYVPERVNGKLRTAEELLADRKSRILPLRQRYPDDFWVLRTYIKCMSTNYVPPDGVVEEFRRRYEARPGDPEATYLYAYALLRKDSHKALELFKKMLEKTPDSPNVLYCLTQIYRSRVFRDQTRHDELVRRYLNRCPDSDAGAALALFAEDPGDISTFVRDLRKRLEGKPQSEIAELHSALWKLEFRITPLVQHEAIRRRIAEDLKFLATLDPDKYTMLTQVLGEGYRLTGNQEAAAKLSKELLAQTRTAPGGAELSAYFEDQQAWSKANPYPTEVDGDEKRKAWTESRLQFLDRWIAKLPDQEFLRMERLRLLDALPAADDVIRVEGERVLDAARATNRAVRTPYSAQMQVAAIWTKRGIALERIPGMVDEALAAAAAAAAREPPAPRTDMYPFPDRRETQDNETFYANTMAWQTLTTSYAKSGKLAQARTVLVKWETALNERRKRIDEYRKAAEAAPGPVHDSTRALRESIARSLPSSESQYFQAAAQVAVAESRKMDALALYQAALRALAGSAGTAILSRSEAARSASALWKELGGTPETWQAWLDGLKATAGNSGWSAKNRPLPGFNLKDLTGKSWTLSSMRGKVTLMNVWATWCGPCRAELPFVQKLHDQLKDRDDIQVITLNMDENIGLLQPFLTERQFTFPVLPARYFVDNFAGFLPVPTSWISDPNGSVKFEFLGFGGNGEDWIRQTLAQMERVRIQAAPAL
jgi:thiol-disulfide isomerase/thioredoxin